MAHDQRQTDWITCPNCHADLANAKCVKCRGQRLGSYWNGAWLYFDINLTQSTVNLNRIKNRIETSVDLSATVVASLILTAYLAYQIYDFYRFGIDFSHLFWQEPSFINLVFWCSTVLALFIVYRQQLSHDANIKIKKLKVSKLVNEEWPQNKKQLSINTAEGIGQQLTRSLEQAYELARQWQHAELRPLHLFAILAVHDQVTQSLLFRLKINRQDLIEKLSHQFASIPQQATNPVPSLSLRKVFIDAYQVATEHHQTQISAYHCLLASWQEDDLLQALLYDLEIDFDKMNNVVIWHGLNQTLIANYKRFKHDALFKPSSNMDRAYTAIATPTLERYSYDLTKAAKFGHLDICIGRETELAEIFENIKSGKTGIILAGENGVGKEVLIAGIAQLMVAEEDVPVILKDKRLLELDVAGLLGGADPAQAQERFMVIANEILRAGNIILVIPEIENITGFAAGSEGSLDLSEILVNSVKRSGLVCLATVSNQNYRKFIESTPLGQAFVKIDVVEPSDNQAIQIIESKISWLESKHKVYFAYEAIADAVTLSERYMHDSFLPEKALQILEKTAVHVNTNKGERSMVEGSDVSMVISELTHINVTKVGSVESQELLQLEDKMHQKMVGQEEAVALVCQSIRRARVELREGKRPIANFLFLGPTGVGKTELAKTLAEVYFGASENMIRLDMSEFQASDAVFKILGSPDGMTGYLTEQVRQLPFALILLDEIEKAAPDVLNLFLQVFDDGRLTDGQGRTIDFTNTIIIATSNIGAVYIQEEVKRGTELNIIKQTIVDRYLVEKMRPELINRFDGIVVFKPLSMANVAQIAGIMIKGIGKSLEDKGIKLSVSEAGLYKLAELGYQVEFGARPLRRLLQDRIENNIANIILAGQVSRRDELHINDQAEIVIIKAAKI